MFYIYLDGLIWKDSSVDVHISDLVKQNKAGRVGTSTTIEANPSEKKMCVVRYPRKYIECTKVLRDSERHLFIIML